MNGIIKRTGVVLLASLILLSTACSKNEKEDKLKSFTHASDVTSIDVAKDMGNGWNLGNTMEAIYNGATEDTPVSDLEKAWGQPVTTKEMIDGIKAAGFNSVRIPIAWSNKLSKDGKYTIPEDFFKRIDEIVRYVLENDMYAIINIHWDTGWWEDFGSKDESVSQKAWDKYKSLWTQISSRYKDYSTKLIFESANEELGTGTGKNVSINDSYKRVTEINQTFVDIVRKSGGKNKERFLLIAGFDTDVDKTCDDRFVMPTDTVKNKLLVSVHYYTPSTFCIANSTTNSWGYKDSWGTDEDYAEMKKYFTKLQKFTDAGYGVIIGEYGVTKKKDGFVYSYKDGSDLFIKSVVDISKENGFCPMLWDTGDWYNRTECKFLDENIAKIFK